MIWAWFINNILFLTRLLVPRHSLVPRPSRVGGRNMEMPPVRPSIPPSFRPSVCPHLSCERDNLRRQSCRVHLLKISDKFKFQRPYFRDILGILATRGRGTLNSIWLVTTGLNWVVNFGPADILGLGSPDCVIILSMFRMTLIRSGPCVSGWIHGRALSGVISSLPYGKGLWGWFGAVSILNPSSVIRLSLLGQVQFSVPLPLYQGQRSDSLKIL